MCLRRSKSVKPREKNKHLPGSLRLVFLDKTCIKKHVEFVEKKLMLGVWQQIVAVDFDTCARTREIVVQIIGE